MAKYKPGDMVVLKKYANVDRFPANHWTSNSKYQALVDASIAGSAIRYVCSHASKNANAAGRNAVKPGEIGIVKGYEHVPFLKYDTYTDYHNGSKFEPQRRVRYKKTGDDFFSYKTVPLMDHEVKALVPVEETTYDKKRITHWYGTDPLAKYLIVLIDGKLVAFDTPGAFETAADATSRYAEVEVVYMQPVKCRNVTEQELQANIRRSLKKVPGLSVGKIFYTLRDGTKKSLSMNDLPPDIVAAMTDTSDESGVDAAVDAMAEAMGLIPEGENEHGDS